MKRVSVSTVILIAIFVIGLSLLLYPTVSDYWNSFRQSRAIASYMETVSGLDSDEYDSLIQQAQAYNDSLVGHQARFIYTEEETAEFRSLLGATGGAVGYIEISAIKLSLPIYLGTSESVLQAGVGVMEGASLPIGGENTHAVLTGHRGLPSATLFTNLDRLVAGDIFTVHILNETATYEVDQILIVEPYDMEALTISEGKDLCTLVTCTPYGINSHRMLVRGHRIETPEDSLFLQVSADALQIEPLVVAPLVAVPILAVLLLWLLLGNHGGGTQTQKLKQTKGKKGGVSGDDDQKTAG